MIWEPDQLAPERLTEPKPPVSCTPEMKRQLWNYLVKSEGLPSEYLIPPQKEASK